MAFQNPTPTEIQAFLARIHTIAVLGLSPNPARPSYGVARSLQRFGYQIIPVRPAIQEVLGEPAAASLQELNTSVDLVDVFRAPEHVPAIVDTCIDLKIPAIWLQDGVIHNEAAQRAQDAGLFVVMDRCIYRDYMRWADEIAALRK
ncbi:MAG: CoA-binding protein [Gammaproteobacteria bacterium]|jgi:predicted CoA-binding protein